MYYLKAVTASRACCNTFEFMLRGSADLFRTDDFALIVIILEKHIVCLFFLRDSTFLHKCGKHIIVKSSGLAQICKHTSAIISFGKGKLPCRLLNRFRFVCAGRSIGAVNVFSGQSFDGINKGHIHIFTE